MIRVRSVFTGVTGTPYYSNLFFPTVTGSVDAKARVDAVRAVWLTWAGNLRTPMQIQVLGEVPVIDEVSGDITGLFNVAPPAVVQCTNAGQPLPPATQLVVRLQTPIFNSGRRLQGRLFVPGWTSDANTNGAPSAPTISDVTTKLAGILTGADRLGVWSRRFGVFAQVDSVSAAPYWGVLRSRRD